MVANFLYNYINLKLFPFKERDEKKTSKWISLSFYVYLTSIDFSDKNASRRLLQYSTT